jgi:hypothetical protein
MFLLPVLQLEMVVLFGLVLVFRVFDKILFSALYVVRLFRLLALEVCQYVPLANLQYSSIVVTQIINARVFFFNESPQRR